MCKYEFVDETLQFRNSTVRRIRRLSDQTLGGFLQSEANLSQTGSCFVHADSIVADQASVTEDAQVYGVMHGAARASGRTQVFGEMWDHAIIEDDAALYGRASGQCRIAGNARVYGEVSGNSVITD